MDRETRNRIQRATQAARELLEHEYAEQLEGVFDIRLDGTIAAEPGEHLDAAQLVLRTKLVTAVEHQRASGMTEADALSYYLREAAFTTLNRFVALKMLEARELVQECISRGHQSGGFKEFTGLAPGLVQLPDHGYRVYIESLFDEIGREVGVLFERRDPASLLWPRRQALLDLLGVLNAPELTGVWEEDETVGWVYQYFNSEEERRQMRAESQAPRNSQELAVRNQFFTPRYVVQFLMDNTLGRMWYEMQQGDTKLCDLEYLVRRPNEVFLAEGRELPANDGSGDEELTREDLIQRPVYVPFCAKKDPRDIRVLDPACGSGHFLLYAFDLLLAIYGEAWADDESPASEVTGRRLRDDYSDFDSLRAAIPSLILHHNLYGIDIDPRCTQIAALALWMRAQRAFKELDSSREARPPIRKTNIVVAEPMPGEPELRREFIATMDPKLGKLVERVFNRMELAGEAGSLLRIEDDIRDVVREIYGQHGELFRETDEDRWRQAELEVLRALRAYAERAANGRAFQRRLFAEDAARALGFIDLCGQRYDVVLMNPPFGEVTPACRSTLYEAYPSGARDVAAAFWQRCVQLLKHGGFFGVLSTRTLLFSNHLDEWRRTCALAINASIDLCADLGYGVLDAVVEAMAVTVRERNGRQGLFAGLLGSKHKDADLLGTCHRRPGSPQWVARDLDTFANVPDARIVYWASPYWVNRFGIHEDRYSFASRPGLTTADDFRYYRCFWESQNAARRGGRWRWIAKGGEYQRYIPTLHLLVDWDSRAFFARTRNSELYFEAGVTYTERTTSNFSARVLPHDACFTVPGPGVIPTREREASFLLALLNSPITTYYLEMLIGSGDHSVRGSAARHFEPTYLGHVPCANPKDAELEWFGAAIGRLLKCLAFHFQDENSPYFAGLGLSGQGLEEAFLAARERRLRMLRDGYVLLRQIEQRLERVLSIDERHMSEMFGDTGWPWPQSSELHKVPREELQGLDVASCSVAPPFSHVEYRFHNKLSHYLHAGIERLSHSYDVSPEAICDALLNIVPSSGRGDWTARLVSASFGAAFGRWSTDSLRASAERDPWSLPIDAPPHGLVGVLPDDPGAPSDLYAEVVAALAELLGCSADEIEESICENLGLNIGLRDWIRSGFFDWHLRKYSASRRRAPVYWQLATPSASYSVWLYYHRFTKDTFYKVLNDYVIPRLQHEERKLTAIKQEAGANPTASQCKEIADQDAFVGELRAFREEVARVAPLWNPDLNDGVIINFAPLWRLVPQNRSWQKECKRVWHKLVAGDYDWSYLAMHLWSERVVPKCAKDRSLAVAHGLEDVFWYENSDGKWQARTVNQAEVDKLVKERTSAAVKDALKSLIETLAPATGRSSRKKVPRAKATRKRTASIRPKAETKDTFSTSRSSAALAPEFLSKVKEAIGANGDGASKSDVINATGISATEWNKVIKALLADGSVTLTGELSGSRYHLGGGEA